MKIRSWTYKKKWYPNSLRKVATWKLYSSGTMVAAVRSLVAISATEYSITLTRFGLELLLNNSLCFVFICPRQMDQDPDRCRWLVIRTKFGFKGLLDRSDRFWVPHFDRFTQKSKIVFLMKYKYKSFVFPAIRFYLVREHLLSEEDFRNVVISPLR